MLFNATPDKKKDDCGNDATLEASLGEAPDELQRLRAENAALKARNTMLNQKLQEALNIQTPGDLDGLPDEELEGEDCTGEALRKRLWRLCRRDGRGCPV